MHDKFKFALPTHILYLFFPDNSTIAVFAKFIIDKSAQVILGRKTMRIEIVPMLIDSSYKVICYSDIKSRSRIRHDIHSKALPLHPAIIPERFRTSRNDRQRSVFILGIVTLCPGIPEESNLKNRNFPSLCDKLVNPVRKGRVF